MSRPRLLRWGRPLVGAAILLALVWRFGAGPFVDGLARTDARALALALAVTAATTWCCARRWCLLAQQLQVPLPLPAAYRAVYRAQLLNATLPGGVVGDVHRGFRHGRESGAMGRALRSVVWDRVTGQLVQVALAVVAVLWLAAAVRTWLLVVVLGAVSAAVLLYLLAPRRFGRAFVAEVRDVVTAREVRWRIVGLSVAAALGHVLVFVVAARTAGVSVPVRELVPLALVVLVASAIPLSLAGWGPREGAAVWVFGATGLGAGVGLEVSVVYGVMAAVATLPGLFALRGRPASAPTPVELQEEGGTAWASGPTPS